MTSLGEAGEAPVPPEDDPEEGEDRSEPEPELDISLPQEPELLMWTL